MTGKGDKPPNTKHLRERGAARATEIRELVDAVRGLPDVRLDKVAAIRKAIESGTYVIDPGKVAQKMIDEILLSRGADPRC